MRRALALAVTLLAGVGLAACGGGAGPSTGSSVDAATVLQPNDYETGAIETGGADTGAVETPVQTETTASAPGEPKAFLEIVDPLGGSGVSGQVIVQEVRGADQITVSVKLKKKKGRERALLLARGSCDAPGTSLRALNTLIQGLGITTVDMTLDTLLSEPAIVLVGDEIGQPGGWVACADLTGGPG